MKLLYTLLIWLIFLVPANTYGQLYTGNARDKNDTIMKYNCLLKINTDSTIIFSYTCRENFGEYFGKIKQESKNLFKITVDNIFECAQEEADNYTDTALLSCDRDTSFFTNKTITLSYPDGYMQILPSKSTERYRLYEIVKIPLSKKQLLQTKKDFEKYVDVDFGHLNPITGEPVVVRLHTITELTIFKYTITELIKRYGVGSVKSFDMTVAINGDKVNFVAPPWQLGKFQLDKK